jgi:hypothetical protein
VVFRPPKSIRHVGPRQSSETMPFSFSFSGKGVRQPSQTVPEPMITHLSPHCGGIYPLLSSVINILIL